MSSPYHSGEIAVQKRVGVREQACDLEGMFRDSIKPAVAEFLAQHQFAVLSSSDDDDNVWASPLSGPAGILAVRDERHIAIQLDRLDPSLDPALVHGPHAGLLVIDFDRRLRLRINGTTERGPNPLTLRISQFYGNCQKYIQRRVLTESKGAVPRSAPVLRRPGIFTALTDPHCALIARSDTFFIATQHPESGADASHRGGHPGFVVVRDDRALAWPDYRGNNLFNTLGNLESDARTGLLFIDFDSGASVQLTGRATAEFGDPSSFSPTGRSVRFDISAIRQLPPSPFLRYSLLESFPYNPPLG